MRANNRRDFLKKSVLAGASLFTVPSFLSAIPNSNIELSQVLENTWESKSDTLLNLISATLLYKNNLKQ
ncbi:twin-arginine translocation signal domain-containing protein [Bacteroides uniformis]|uniref:twin-arginine translocation signal domain-containing protein n=1 Tax=Bacteroides uniformis TaxID=820 RepID=UPI001F018731